MAALDFLPSVAALTHIDVSFGTLSNLAALSATPLLVTFIADQNRIESIMAVPALANLETMSLNKNCLADTEVFVAEIQHR
jgi:hypothetical protein